MKKVITLYVEGETEEEFYNKLNKHLKSKYASNNYIIKVVCVKSNTRFACKLVNKFKNEIISKYSKEEKIVCLCYDSDGFEFGKHPVINVNKLENDLKNAGANKIIHIVANKTIEDYIMIDSENVIKFLGLPKTTKIKGKDGLEKIKKLYSQANKTYFKGNRTSGLIDLIDMEKICNNVCQQISPLCKEIDVCCTKCKKSLDEK